MNEQELRDDRLAAIGCIGGIILAGVCWGIVISFLFKVL